MKLLTQKKKRKIAKNIIKLGFTEQDIIDAADSILDSYTMYQLSGDRNVQTKEERAKGNKKEGKTKAEKESYERGKGQVKGKIKRKWKED